jgi:hypothetical protein
LQTLTTADIEAKLKPFTKEIFVESVEADHTIVSYFVTITDQRLLNDHFPGVSIIQCFFQGAMLMFYENDVQFDPEISLFLAGGLKIKFLNPIFAGNRVSFQVKNRGFINDALLFEGMCVNPVGEAYANASGSLSSKLRTEVEKQKQQFCKEFY